MATVFINGTFVDTNDSDAVNQISLFDAGFQHGVGLFETFLATCEGNTDQPNGAHVTVPNLNAHLSRLAQSAEELNLSKDLNTQALAEAVHQTVAKANLPKSRVRLMITGGDLNMLQRAAAGDAQAHHTPTLMIACQPATDYPAAMFENGVTVAIAKTRANPLNAHESHKTLNYWWRLSELQSAAAQGAAESIVFQVTNHLAGGCVSNLFIVKNGELFTPIARGDEELVASIATAKEGRIASGATVPSPVLPGITRSNVIGAAHDENIPVHRRMLTINELLDADEVFLTNASWTVLPVVRVEGKQIGDGRVGEMTRKMRSTLV
ncbi:MAG: aminotransferase class IV [Phycisphaeraceae bacterium]|nr:aminotransferase class IV family protein [Phycisphaerales bacterium]MCB9859605.1 aminotransferase class IV [Phycisphaeraceae bacterium]